MPTRSKYICVKCEQEMMPLKNEVVVEEHADDGGHYRIWMADLWRCPVCLHECIVGFGNNPLAHYFEKEKWAQWLPLVEYHIHT
jgi:hypothetical protein